MLKSNRYEKADLIIRSAFSLGNNNHLLWKLIKPLLIVTDYRFSHLDVVGVMLS